MANSRVDLGASVVALDIKAEHQDCSCPVCLDSYTVDGKNAMKVIVDCQHSVCAECLPSQKTCPVCRASITKTTDTPFAVRDLLAGNATKVATLVKENNQLKAALTNKDLDPKFQPIRNAKIILAKENLNRVAEKQKLDINADQLQKAEHELKQAENEFFEAAAKHMTALQSAMLATVKSFTAKDNKADEKNVADKPKPEDSTHQLLNAFTKAESSKTKIQDKIKQAQKELQKSCFNILRQNARTNKALKELDKKRQEEIQLLELQVQQSQLKLNAAKTALDARSKKQNPNQIFSAGRKDVKDVKSPANANKSQAVKFVSKLKPAAQKALDNALLESVNSNDPVSVRSLLEDGADPNITSIQDEFKKLPIVTAVLNLQDDVVVALIKAGANVNVEIRPTSSRGGDTNYRFYDKAMLTLTTYLNNSTSSPSTLLYETIRMKEKQKHSALRMLKLLLTAPDIDIKKVNNNFRRNTPLHAAVDTNEIEFVFALINHRNQNDELILQVVDRNAKNNGDQTPLEYGRSHLKNSLSPVIEVMLSEGDKKPVTLPTPSAPSFS